MLFRSLLIRDQQDVVTQHVRVANPYGPCITVQGSTNVVIRKSVVGPYGDIAIRSYGNENVTISRVLVHDAAAHGVLIRLSTDVKVRESHFERVRTGVGAISSSGISVTCPQFLYQGLR